MGYWYTGQWFDQDQISLNTFDPSFIFGATIFTTLRVFNHSLEDPRTRWEKHGDRLRNAVKNIHWAEPDWERITTGATKVAEHYPVVRITLLSDGRELILGRQLPDDLAEKQQDGIAAWVAADSLYQRPQAAFKTGNYLGAWQALQQAIQRGAGEAILISTTGEWLETATGNLWGFAAGKFYTPPLGNILSGVMRSHLIQQLEKSNVPVLETPWDRALIQNLEAIAYSNSVVGVIPFTEILGADLQRNVKPDHSALRQLQQLSEI